MRRKEERLFIGGPVDGRALEVHASATVQVPIFGMGVAIYRREVLVAGEREHIVYVIDDIPGADIIGRLIAGYGVGPTIAEREI